MTTKPLVVRLHALRLSTLRLMAQVSAEDPESILKVKRRWAYFKLRAAEEATEEGEAYEVVRSFYSTEEFRHYKTIQKATDPYFGSEKQKERGRAASQKWYSTKGSEARKTPEARARLADARKRQREVRRASVGESADLRFGDGGPRHRPVDDVGLAHHAEHDRTDRDREP